jgi:hypothetical protein
MNVLLPSISPDDKRVKKCHTVKSESNADAA